MVNYIFNMPSYARKHQLTGNIIFHVYNRSNARLKIFHQHDDYQFFIQRLIDYRDMFEVKVYHWVIMSNHYHLLLEIQNPEQISRMMAGLQRSYTHYYHKTYKTNGFLWQGRYKMQPIQKDRYLLTCGRYIERNPVEAGFVNHPSQYPYSSARFYCLHIKHEDKLTGKDPLFETFHNYKNQRKAEYYNYLKDFDAEEEESFNNLEMPKGCEEFLRALIKQEGRYNPRRRGRKRERIVL